MNKFRLFAMLVFITTAGYAQQQLTFKFNKQLTLSLNGDADLFQPALKISTLPKPETGADEALIESIKKEQEILYRSKRKNGNNNQQFSLLPPGMFRNFIGNNYNYFVPNDNDCAISDSNIITSVTN